METPQLFEICSELTKNKPELCHWRCSSVFIVNFKQISHIHCPGVSIVDYK